MRLVFDELGSFVDGLITCLGDGQMGDLVVFSDIYFDSVAISRRTVKYINRICHVNVVLIENLGEFIEYLSGARLETGRSMGIYGMIDGVNEEDEYSARTLNIILNHLANLARENEVVLGELSRGVLDKQMMIDDGDGEGEGDDEDDSDDSDDNGSDDNCENSGKDTKMGNVLARWMDI